MIGSSPVPWESVLTDHYARLRSSSCVLGRQVQTVRAGVDFKKTAVLSGLFDHSLDVDLVPGAFEQEASRGMSQDVEIAVIHGTQKTLGLLFPVEREAGMNGANRIVELT